MQARYFYGILAVAVAAVWMIGVPGPAGKGGFPELNQQFEPLRAQFNADAGKVRLLLLLDPT